MLRNGTQLQLSEYAGIYDLVIPADHLLRKIKENVDFSFVNPMLKEQYCEHFGRPAKEPEMMFKILFLKRLYDLSDEVLVRDLSYNMAYKYFVGLQPEEGTIDPSLLTKFRKTRINQDILEEMLGETIHQAIEKDLIKSQSVIVDSTHAHSKGNRETPTQVLRRLAKSLRKEIYKTQPELAQYFPEKPSETAELEEEIRYTKVLVEVLEQRLESKAARKLRDNIAKMLEDDQINNIQSGYDLEAKTGYKSKDSSFFGYKNHLAMTDERLITAIEVTPGQEADTTKLKSLVEKTVKNGVKVEEVIGDKAYSSKDNLEYCEDQGIKLISRLSAAVTNGHPRDEGFLYNKDAGTMQCPQGHLAMSCQIRKHKNGSQYYIYWFSVKTCKKCPYYGTCCKTGAKRKSYCLKLSGETHQKQYAFEQTEYFNKRIKDRYKIEAKNAELKQVHGLDRCKYVGLFGMRIQMYFTAFVANVKRMIRLKELAAAQ
ncbi:MAG: IS1182 family transposase [Dehalobacter sp.]|nr:IS1182 family transposase [Dehalobacter sp.]